MLLLFFLDVLSVLRREKKSEAFTLSGLCVCFK